MIVGYNQSHNGKLENYRNILLDSAVTEKKSNIEKKDELNSSVSKSQYETNRDVLGDSICSLANQARSGCEKSRSAMLGQLRNYLSIIASSKMNAKFQAKFGESDVVQQSIAVAIEKFDDFRGQTEGELFGWANKILRNEILQQQRALLSDKRNMFREQNINALDNSASFQIGIVDMQLTPKSNAIRREQSEAVERAIERLPENYRAVICMRNSEQLSFADIGSRMNKSENAVTKLWFRALVQLRKELEAEDV